MMKFLNKYLLGIMDEDSDFAGNPLEFIEQKGWVGDGKEYAMENPFLRKTFQ